VHLLGGSPIGLAGCGIGIILKAGFGIRAKKEAGCRIFAYMWVRDFLILISDIRDSDRF